MSDWIYFDEQSPEDGQDILIRYNDGSITEYKWMEATSDFGTAWIPAPTKRIKYTPIKPGRSLYGPSPKARFRHIGPNCSWLHGTVEGVSLDGESFYCRTYNTDSLDWYPICEIAV